MIKNKDVRGSIMMEGGVSICNVPVMENIDLNNCW